jgi:hypothetical protein
MIVNTDIDIDVADRNKLLRLIKNTPAMMNNKGRKQRHNTGVYFHEVPTDPFTGLATVDYTEAEQLGFFKIDILNVNIYESIKNPAELDELMAMEPMWELLEHREVVEKLFHIHSHYDIVKRMRPRSVEQLAAVLAVIRPAKRYLLGKDWDTVFREVWLRPEGDEYFFKKAHAVSYSVAIVVQLNQLVKNSSSLS